MTHEETSLNTKKRLAASLKKFMTTKSLNKITVSDIIRDANVNRKTFYYHFEDIYALLKWILEEEAVEVVKKYDLFVDYKDAILFVISYVEENAHILACAYDAIGRDEMRKFLYQDFISVTKSLIDGVEQEMGLHADENFKQFLANFYADSLAGILIEWFKNPKGRDKEQVVDYLSIIFHASLGEILKKAPE